MKAVLLVALLAAAAFSAAGTALAEDEVPDASHASRYFGHVAAPCSNPRSSKCQEFTERVKCATGDEKACPDPHEHPCRDIDVHCLVGEKILEQLYGTGIYRETLPDFIVFADDEKVGNTYTLKVHDPLLMWRGMNTPHLMGVRAIYVIVLAHNKLSNITAHVTSDSTYEPNPLVGLLGTVNAPEIKLADKDTKRTQQNGAAFEWHDLTGGSLRDQGKLPNSKDLVTWAGIASIEVPDNSINRVTVAYDGKPKAAEAPDDSSNRVIVAYDKLKKSPESDVDIQITVKKPEKASATTPDKYNGDFLAETGHFSNSPASYTAISFALGTTFNSRNTSIAKGGSNVSVDGFMLAKFYICRPHLYAVPHSIRRYSPSLGFVLGTNVNGGVFNDIVVGVSFGHLIGNVGVVVGLNSIAGKDGSTQGRKSRLMLGMEYTF